MKEIARSLAAICLILLHACPLDAQPIHGGSGSEILGSCHDAGYTSCCPGRNDSCLGNPPLCYCDHFCLTDNASDCCEDMINETLRCGSVTGLCAPTLEARVRGLAEIQIAIAETYVGLPDHFATTRMYLQVLTRQVNTLFMSSDENSNNELDRNEFHLLYESVVAETNTKMAICEDDLLQFCDDNQDGLVSTGELQLCTGALEYCDTRDDTAVLLASELLVSQLQPVFADIIARDQYSRSIFPFSDRDNPKGLLDINEFRVLHARTIEFYNVLPSVCSESVFQLCNTDDDQFVSLTEVILCGSNGVLG